MASNTMAQLYAAAAAWSRGWLDASLGDDGRLARVARAWGDGTLGVERILAQAARRSGQDLWAVLEGADATPTPAVFLSRVGDLARAQAFLWAEAGLTAQERVSRAARVPASQAGTGPAWLARALVLGTVASDLWVGYATLRERARRRPDLVGPVDWELQHRRGAARTLDTAASLGGVLIKAGQFASTRPDLLPSAYVAGLAALQDRVPPQPWSVIEPTIGRELGRPPGEVFAALEPEPVAAASIAQVHRARLPDGRAVAVKVQYPAMAEIAAADLAALELIAATIVRLEPAVRLGPIVDYLRQTLPLELDFRREAKALADLRDALAGRDDVVIPAVIDELSTARLLVMEWVDGIKITDRAALLGAGIDPRAVARTLNDLYAEQLFRRGFLHADPHPGNLLVQPGPRLVLLDHGLTVALPPGLVEALGEMVRALATGDFEALAAALTAAGLRLEAGLDLAALLQLVGVLLGGERPGAMADVGDVGRRLGAGLGEIPVDLLLVGRALGLLDGITRQLDPELDALELVARHPPGPDAPADPGPSY